MKQLTLRKIIAAIKKAKKQDQIPWGIGSFINARENNEEYNLIPGSSCAIGLALRGLGYDPHKDYSFSSRGWKLRDAIQNATGFEVTQINDRSRTYEEMMGELEAKAKMNDVLDKEFKAYI